MDPILSQLVSQQLGPQPGAAPAAAAAADPAAATAAAAQAQPAAQTPPKADPAPTAAEKAAVQGDVKDDGKEAAITLYDIPDGDGMRQMTPQQIRSTLDRYSDLNYRWQQEVAPAKPVMEVVQQLMSAAKANGHDANHGEVADLIKAAVQAYVSNPQMGQAKAQQGADKGGKAAMGQADQQSGTTPPEGDIDFEGWERENAVKLPPGYREQMQSAKAMQGQMQQIMQMLQGLSQQQQGGQAVQAQQQQAQVTQASAAKQAIINNLNIAAQQNGLPDSASGDFFMFASQRGYSPEDFIDPQLTATVMADYKANKDAPEINRLREIAQRRQAFTGSVDGTPAGGGAAAAAGGDPMLAQLIGKAMGQR